MPRFPRMITGLLSLIVYIAIIGLIVWAIITIVPMPQPFKTVIVVIGALVCLLILLGALGGAPIKLSMG